MFIRILPALSVSLLLLVTPNAFAAERAGTWFDADGFSFGVEREMKESGEKGYVPKR